MRKVSQRVMRRSMSINITIVAHTSLQHNRLHADILYNSAKIFFSFSFFPLFFFFPFRKQINNSKLLYFGRSLLFAHKTYFQYRIRVKTGRTWQPRRNHRKYSLHASWKQTMLTPHMAATSTISSIRLCRAATWLWEASCYKKVVF